MVFLLAKVLFSASVPFLVAERVEDGPIDMPEEVGASNPMAPLFDLLKKQFDVNNNGKIDPEELHDMTQKNGLPNMEKMMKPMSEMIKTYLGDDHDILKE